MEIPKVKSKHNQVLLISVLLLFGAIVESILFAFFALTFLLFGSELSGVLILLTGFFFFCLMVFIGVQNMVLIKKSKQISTFLKEENGRCSIDTLAHLLNTNTDSLLKSLSHIFNRRYLTNVKLDLERKELVSLDAPEATNEVTSDTIIQIIQVQSVYPALILIGSLLLCIGAMGPKNILMLLVAIVIPVVIAIASFYVFRKESRFKEVPKPSINDIMNSNDQDEKTKKAKNTTDTSDPLEVAFDQYKDLQALSGKLKGSKIGGTVENLTKTAYEILIHIHDNPEKVNHVRQFLNYYYPTTIKLLTEYSDLTSKEISTENSKAAIAKIEGLTSKIETTFNGELNNLHLDKAVDISAEIDVMESMIQSEGMDSEGIKLS